MGYLSCFTRLFLTLFNGVTIVSRSDFFIKSRRMSKKLITRDNIYIFIFILKSTVQRSYKTGFLLYLLPSWWRKVRKLSGTECVLLYFPSRVKYFRLLTSTYFTKTKKSKQYYNLLLFKESEWSLSEGEIFAISDNMPGLHRNRGGDDNPPRYKCTGLPHCRQHCDD